jgi:lysophospholipase L1-like esterase
MNKKIKAVILIILAVVLVAGIYLGNTYGLFNKGNYGKYSLKNTDIVENSPLNDKTVIFLGSSVTYGYASMGISFADFLQKSDGINAIKEAVSGTTLVDVKDNSYVSRMKTIDKNTNADAFVCQLSTNDATKEMLLGEISESYDIDDFDTRTVAGAIEYIIAYAKNTWYCPVVFYTQSEYNSDHYDEMVDLLLEIQKKWDITVIDLWNDAEFNNITEEQRSIYLIDHIHPTKAGDKEWWLAKFREVLYEVIR